MFTSINDNDKNDDNNSLPSEIISINKWRSPSPNVSTPSPSFNNNYLSRNTPSPNNANRYSNNLAGIAYSSPSVSPTSSARPSMRIESGESENFQEDHIMTEIKESENGDYESSNKIDYSNNSPPILIQEYWNNLLNRVNACKSKISSNYNSFAEKFADHRSKYRIVQYANIIVKNDYFDRFILAAIVASSIFLSISDYTHVDENDNLVSQGSPRNQAINESEIYFVGIFFAEFILKVIALGFCIGPNSYLNDSWNWLDFVVVLSSVISLIPSIPSTNIRVLRTLRVLRPLKSVKSIPELATVVTVTLKSLQHMGNIGLALVFFFIVFGILGLQLFNGPYMHAVCRETPFPVKSNWSYGMNMSEFRCLDVPNFNVIDSNSNMKKVDSPWYHSQPDCYWPIDTNSTRLCGLPGTTGNQCSNGFSSGLNQSDWSYCGSDYDAFGNSRFSSTLPNQATYTSKLGYNTILFDHLGYAILVVLQMISGNGWSSIMYQINDAIGVTTGAPFSILLVMIGNFFLLQLNIAILSGFLGNERQEAWEKLNAHKMASKKIAQIFMRSVSSSSKYSIEKAEENETNENVDNDFSISRSESLVESSKIPQVRSVSFYMEFPSAKNALSYKMAGSNDLGDSNKDNNSIEEIDMDDRYLEDNPYYYDRNGEEKADRASFDNINSPVSEDEEGENNNINNNEGDNNMVELPEYPSQKTLSKRKTTFKRFRKKIKRNISKIKPESTMGIIKDTINSYDKPDQNSFRRYCRTICEHTYFDFFFTICILANTAVMSLDRYPIDNATESIVVTITFLLTILFSVELALKLTGFGIVNYFSDNSNFFDFIIVIVSLVDLAASPIPALLQGESEQTQNEGSFSALRGFRLLRLLRLLRSETFRVVLAKIGKVIISIKGFIMLLFLYLFILALVGMQFFANRFRFSDDGYHLPINSVEWKDSTNRPRSNFDNFFLAFMCVFQLLTLDSWTSLLQQSYQASGAIGMLFPILCIMLGSFLIVNLFLAMLMDTYLNDTDDNNVKKSNSNNNSGYNSESDKNILKSQSCDSLSYRKQYYSTNDDTEVQIKRYNSELFNIPIEPIDDTPKTQASSNYYYYYASTNPIIDYITWIGKIFDNILKYILSFILFKKLSEYCREVASHVMFEIVILVLILISCGTLILNSPLNDPNSHFTITIFVFDVIITAIFCLEMVIKMIGFGLFCKESKQANTSAKEIQSSVSSSPRKAKLEKNRAIKFDTEIKIDNNSSKGFSNDNDDSNNLDNNNDNSQKPSSMDEDNVDIPIERNGYFRSSWNILDFIVVSVSLVAIFGQNNPSLSAVSSIKALRALRPLRLVNRFKGLKTIVTALGYAVPSVSQIGIVYILVYFMFAIFFTNFLKGQLRS
eukprot:gene11920-15952_t